MGSGKDKKKKQKKQVAAATGKPVAKAKSTQQKAKKRQAGPGEDEDEKDIETILEELRVAHEATVKVTEDSGCAPPAPRCNASLITVPGASNSDLILFGGEFYNGQKCIFYNDLFRYNPERNEWRRFTSPTCPGPRSSHQLVATATGRAFLVGGEFASTTESQFFHYKDFWVLDLKTHQWERFDPKGPRPSPRSGHRMLLWKHFIILFGGFYDTLKETKYYDDLWVLDTNEYTWRKIEFKETDLRPGCARFPYLFVLY